MSKNYIKVTFEAWPCELRNSLLIAMQCNICKYCIVVTVICVKYAWHKDGAVLNIDMIQQTCVCSTSKICWFFNDLIHGRERWVGSIWIVPSDLSANAQPPENAVNEQMDRWTDRQTNNNIHKHPWMLSVSHLDTSACQIVGHFFQALCMQYTNPSPWMVGRTDERMKWQQYPSASMLAKGKSSGNICISNSMPFLPSDLSANVQKPENVVNRPIDGQTDGQTDGQKSGRGALLLGVLLCPPQLGLGGNCDKKWKFKNVEKITSFSDAVTLTFDLRP